MKGYKVESTLGGGRPLARNRSRTAPPATARRMGRGSVSDLIKEGSPPMSLKSASRASRISCACDIKGANTDAKGVVWSREDARRASNTASQGVRVQYIKGVHGLPNDRRLP